jgi:hypothetical protein
MTTCFSGMDAGQWRQRSGSLDTFMNREHKKPETCALKWCILDWSGALYRLNNCSRTLRN